jgi:glyoxylase-like metal-dependent hydrolase (beta-lactamase superfamily II)
MSPTTVTENLFQVSRFGGLVNAYLVREKDGFTLIDTLIPGSAQRIIDQARVAGAEIRRIALTHAHTDHAGSLDALKRSIVGSIEVSIPELDARILAGEKVVEGKLKGGWPKVSTTPDVRLNAGDRVGSLEVVPSPGHTPGHVAFLDTRDRALIAGDVFTSVGGLAVSNHFHLPFPFAYMATSDRAKDLESAKSLRALNPSVLVLGHGAPVRDPGPAMDKAITAAGG